MVHPTEIASEIFGRLRGIAKQIVEGHGGIFRELAKEHGELTLLFDRIVASDDIGVRKEVFPTLREELLSHGKAEQREFYPVLQNSEECRPLIEQALLDHREIEQLVEELHGLEYSDPIWSERCTKLKNMVATHVDLEENQIFEKAKDLLSRDELDQMEKRYQAARKAELEAYATLH